MSHQIFAPDFVPLAGSPADCAGCARGERVGFDFDYAYQPIVNVESREVFACEALVRGPQGEPASWVLDQVHEGNRYRFDQACRVKAIKGAREFGVGPRISINFLPNAIYRPEVCIRTTLEAARTHGMPLDRIIFEVTEGEEIADGPWFASILREYKRCGFLTAIDDFGAGFAGLKLLSDFQPDIIKLDMGLVRNVERDKPRQAIVRNLCRMCEELDIDLVAEGVETVGERDFLRDEGVCLMQGFLFARPAFRQAPAIDPTVWPAG